MTLFLPGLAPHSVQGGEPRTVAFLHNLGLDYVSCSPFRVPIARLAAAQAAVKAARKATHKKDTVPP